MELRQYFQIIRKWLWLLVLGAILGGGASYLFSIYQQPVYQSTAKVMVSQPSRDQLSDLGYLSGQQLVLTYSELLLTSPVLNEVSQYLDTDVTSNMITVQQVRDTNILSVKVEDINPDRAAIIANLLIDVLVRQNEALQASRFSASEESLKSQIEVVQGQIAALEEQIASATEENLQTQLVSVEEQISILQNDVVALQLNISELQSQIDQGINLENQGQLQQYQLDLDQKQSMLDLYQELYFNLISYDTGDTSSVFSGSGYSSQYQGTLALYQQIYANLLSDYEAVRLSRLENSVTVFSVEPAVPDKQPVRPKPIINTMLGIAVGLMFSGGIVFLIEYLDDTVKSADEIHRLTSIPIIGYLPKIELSSLNGNNKSAVYVQERPQSPVADAFRSLRTNIEFSGVTFPAKRIMVTSPEPGVGKSSTAANLASILVQAGNTVVLIDADLRKPNVHRYYKFSNRFGLSEYILGNLNTAQAFKYVEGSKRLIVIPSGKLPPNPAELLASEKMNSLLQELEEVADYIIIDTPPLMIPDSLALSNKVDGVLLVIQPGKTQLSFVKAAIDQLQRAESRIIGMVFNNTSNKTGRYYSNYYQTPYYQREE